MTLRRYSGKLYYPGNDHIDVSAFIVRDNEIAFSLASVTQEYGRWEAESGRTATLQPDGSYLVTRVQTIQNGVPGVPWDILFHINHETSGELIEVLGTLAEGGELYEFEGELDAWRPTD